MHIKSKILFLLLAVTFTAQSCNLLPGKQGRQIELTWWKPFDTAQDVQPLIEAFQAAYPNIRINYVQKNIETFEDELIDALAAGRGPDIFSIHNDWLPKHRDKLAPAPEKIFPLRELRENFIEAVSFDLTTDDRIYAVPLAVDVLALYYNKDIFNSAGVARPPATWEELVDLVPRLGKQDALGNFQRSGIAMGTADNINRATDIISLLMLQNGTPLSAEGGAANIDQPARDEAGNPYVPGARALEFYTQFANPQKVTYTWNNRANNSIDAFAAGQATMMLSYNYMRDILAEKAPLLNYGIAAVPQIDPGLSRVNYPNYWAEAVAKQSPEQEAAWQFLKFITGREPLAGYYEAKKQVSPRVDLLEQQISDEQIGVFAENALSAKSFHKSDSDAVENIFAQMIDDVTLRNISPQEAVSAAAQKIELLMRNF